MFEKQVINRIQKQDRKESRTKTIKINSCNDGIAARSSN